MVNPIHPYLGHDIAITRGGTTRHETVPGGPTYDYQLAHVLAQMRGEAASLTGGSDAVENMVVIDAIYRAAGLPLRGED